MTAPVRRARLRAATMAEAREVARRLLVERGTSAVTVNAVAREMGMSGPALYRYFTGHEELVEAITIDFFRELTGVITAARDVHAGEDAGVRLLAMCRAMRGWAVAHPAEFEWTFARPARIPRGPRREESPRFQAGDGFEKVFLGEFVDLWEGPGFPVPEATRLGPALWGQLCSYSERIDGALPPSAAHVFLSTWTRIYGLLCMEVLHQLDFAYSDVGPLFEECLHEVCASLGLEYTPPSD
ncbi:MAG TPA: TetR family transcriptional regulator [Nocardiopsis listeri]|uniref:TetR/AcrR family transcriptional regulator n=1 Tax=Nocardiopsis listeri TaxID=53440 RepID=UPI001D370203|nr:TetR/AcrR family transcriptional regulator [Nocardiopsis listeri]HJE61781.1 TetR family transcriptional regulator [Nocardiopsis listeri]